MSGRQRRRQRQHATDTTAIIDGNRGEVPIGIHSTRQRDTAHLSNSEMDTTSLCTRSERDTCANIFDMTKKNVQNNVSKFTLK